MVNKSLEQIAHERKVVSVEGAGKGIKGEQKQVAIFEGALLHGKPLVIGSERLCKKCGPTHINCMSPKDWLKSQIGVWQFFYESRDIRDKSIHPATFPISLAKKVIELFTHEGQLVLDPFVGSGTSLIAANHIIPGTHHLSFLRPWFHRP